MFWQILVQIGSFCMIFKYFVCFWTRQTVCGRFSTNFVCFCHWLILLWFIVQFWGEFVLLIVFCTLLFICYPFGAWFCVYDSNLHTDLRFKRNSLLGDKFQILPGASVIILQMSKPGKRPVCALEPGQPRSGLNPSEASQCRPLSWWIPIPPAQSAVEPLRRQDWDCEEPCGQVLWASFKVRVARINILHYHIILYCEHYIILYFTILYYRIL
jgi:hypothetical protein